MTNVLNNTIDILIDKENIVEVEKGLHLRSKKSLKSPFSRDIIFKTLLFFIECQ